ncbi:LLM class flavin-dependent oxidoreductase [Dactylosporangium sp. NBC_01737]|uniref:LLM class flavin-dependent oxidoreductase n=1 Tax=Dactylosporangium sp. NBC_01737 TaxID=2975959 RepID=UPI002E0F1D18|nr:LLM class flavin-dependent oxidoreductase [Dactylosporangium sp. NBC_01737]
MQPFAPVEVYTTAPASVQVDGPAFRRRLTDVTRWTDAAGCTGLLVYSDNTLVDPWLVAQLILDAAPRATPLVAVQPVYLSPYTAARMAATLTFLHGRQVHLNLVTGGSRQHLEALGDAGVGHDERYERLTEYATIVRLLLDSPRPVTFTGRYYQVLAATLPHRPPATLAPRLVLSGSSDSSVRCADELGILRFAYPRPADDYPADGPLLRGNGIRIGIIARPDGDAAWRVAHDRFPGDPLGERRHRIVSRLSDSHWHAELSGRPASDGIYWLHPFLTYRTFCPYLVGDYDEVGAYLARYLTRGVGSVILDVPEEEDDLHHARIAFARAVAPVSAAPRE